MPAAPAPSSLPLETLNTCPDAEFEERGAFLFESEATGRKLLATVRSARPFASSRELHASIGHAVRGLGKEEKLAMLRDANRLGVNRAAVTAKDAKQEHKRAGLDDLSEAEREHMRDLNERYEARFGWLFCLAIGNRTKDEIIAAFEERLRNEPEVEFDICVDNHIQLAGLRIAKCIVEEPAAKL